MNWSNTTFALNFLIPKHFEIHKCEMCGKDRECVGIGISINDQEPPEIFLNCGLCLIQLRKRFEAMRPGMLSPDLLEDLSDIIVELNQNKTSLK